VFGPSIVTALPIIRAQVDGDVDLATPGGHWFAVAWLVLLVVLVLIRMTGIDVLALLFRVSGVVRGDPASDIPLSGRIATCSRCGRRVDETMREWDASGCTACGGALVRG
jgi:hypothetical protein